MSEFEDKLNSILNDPEQMDKIANMAKSLMGGDTTSSSAGNQISAAPAQLFDGLDPSMLQGMGKLLSGMNQADDEKTALLEAMKPYLKEKRREKMDRAMKIAKMARLAELALGEFGGKFHV